MPHRLLTAFIVLVSLRAADTLAGGPYVLHVSQKSATVAWIVQSSEVRLGLKPGEWSRSSPVLRVEKVNYTNLEPGTTYYYDVPGQAAGKGSFRTAQAGRAAFKFVVYGDTRTRHELHRKISDVVAKAAPDFVVHTGDLVQDGNDTALWPVFFSIEKELLRKTAFYPSLGNHERNNAQYYEFFDVKTPYYSFDWGSAHFTILNSDLGNIALSAQARDQFWTEQQRWLEDDLRKSQSADMRFLVLHHPPFTAVKSRQGGNRQVAAMVPLFERYKVTAVFNGHDHNYQHHVQNGVHYIVTGGGGAPLYPVDGPIPGITQKVESTEHFVQVGVDGAKARAQAIGLDGRIIDTVDFLP